MLDTKAVRARHFDTEDMGEVWRILRKERAERRFKFGIPCPECVAKLPKACPTILLPQQRCKIHGYKDTRYRLEDQP
jgi:hypothetical protein